MPTLTIEYVDPLTIRHCATSLVLVEGRCSEELRGEIRVELGCNSIRASRIGSRFEAILDVDETLAPGDHRLRAALSTGRTEYIDERRVVVAGRVDPQRLPTASENSQGALVGICLATHEPRIDLFQRQVDSIRRQRHRRFVCVISDDCSSLDAWARIQGAVADDPRFVCSRSSTRLGFYRNFERCLALTPSAVEFVALADQDDYWHADKLATLVHALSEGHSDLVFSDMRLVDDRGALLSPTFWTHAQNNTSSLADMLLANTVTGASALFRRDLLNLVLPFPPAVSTSYHDHWIACVAVAARGILYVDRPLYDYVQHSSNTSGPVTLTASYEGGIGRIIRRVIRAPWLSVRNGLEHAATTYRDDALRVELFARTLESRFGSDLRPDDAKVVRRAARLLESTHASLWLLQRSLRDFRGRGVTLGVENNLLKAVFWRRAYVVLRHIARSP